MAARISQAQARGLLSKRPQQSPSGQIRSAKPNKYGAKAIETPDGRFDSQGEYRRWLQLRILEKCGDIQDLRRQVPYNLTVNGQKVAAIVIDFCYIRNGALVNEDFKSPATMTPVFRLKRKLLLAIHGVDLEISQ